MAEVQTCFSKNSKTGKRMHKKNTRVDLTPMVDLGFLLISFFVFTTTMAKPRAMSMVYPKESDIQSPVCESCALTVIPAGRNTIYYYEGMLRENTLLQSAGFAPEEFRQLLLAKKSAVKAARGNADEVSLIIRPADACSYKNFVDVLDEINITGIKRYYIDDITPEEKKLLDTYR